MGSLAVASPLVVISTHLDDGVLSCGHLLAAHPAAYLVTVTAGGPDMPASAWDLHTTGKTSARAAVKMRRGEDADAALIVGAKVRHLEFFDSPYLTDGPQNLTAIASALEETISELHPKSVGIPLGFHHSDHVAISDACLNIPRDDTAMWFVYEDQPYALAFPDERDARLAELRTRGIPLEPEPQIFEAGEIKERAVKRYGSQVPALRDGPDFRDVWPGFTAAPERFWRLASD